MKTETHVSSIDRMGTDWRDRRVLVVGLGKSGMAAAKLLRRVGSRVRVTEAGQTEALQGQGRQLFELGVEQLELGGHSHEVCDDADVLVVSPGVPESAAPVRWAQAAGVPVISEVELAFLFCHSPIVAVTGTNGKSSTVTLIEQVLRAARRPTIACGNLGTPFCAVVSDLTPETTVVLEISSFQLLHCQQFRPQISVLLNLGINHLDRHPDHAGYVAAKARLFARQTPSDVAVLNSRDAQVAALSSGIYARQVWFGELGEGIDRVLSPNEQAALQVARLLGVPDPLTVQMIREFKGLEHRLEYVATVGGVTFINDSKSTTPDSLLYALGWTQGAVVPIIGGKDKGMDFAPLQRALAGSRVRGVVLIGETRNRLQSLLRGREAVRASETLEGALTEALAISRAGDTVLFSPACASFDMFKNFEDRGRVFKLLVSQLGARGNGHG